jgi:GNAT superfamily N-acetyltransferase
MLTLRPATREDVPTIRNLIRELAEFERELDSAVVSETDLLRDGFGAEPYFHAVIADWEKTPVGLALYFFNYSTWQGRPGLYLEDLYVKPSHRRHGIGSALLQHVAKVAVERHCGRLVWQVLDWNEKAIEFYRSLGAPVLKEWLTMRLSGDDIARLAGGRRLDAR